MYLYGCICHLHGLCLHRLQEAAILNLLHAHQAMKMWINNHFIEFSYNFKTFCDILQFGTSTNKKVD